MFGYLIFIAFWVCAVLLWINVGWRPGVVFIALWVVGFFGIPALELAAPAFTVYELVLTIPLALWLRADFA